MLKVKMSSGRLLVGMALMTILALPLSAQDSLDLSIDDAVNLAVEGNLSLKQSQVELNAARRANNFSWNSISPNISAGVSFTDNLLNDVTSLSLSGSVGINLTPSLYTTIRNAALSYEQSELTYEKALRTIELNVRKAYYKILYDIENVNLKQRNLETAKRQYNSNRTKYNSGSLSRLDVLSAQVNYQNAEVSLQEAKNLYESDLVNLRQTLGLALDQEITLTGSLADILSIKEITLEGIEIVSSNIQSLTIQLETARNALLATRFSAWGPTFSARYNYNASVTNKKYDNPGTLTLSANIPLDGYLPWSTGAQSIQKQKDTIKKLQLQIDDAKTSYDISVNNYLTQINQYMELIKLRQANIEVAQQSYDMTLDAYNRGVKDIMSLQNSADNLNQAKVNLMSQAYTLICSILDLENTVGVPFGSLGK